METKRIEPEIYGLMAEFDQAPKLLEAARRAREAGYRKMDAYTPFPVEGLSESLGAPKTTLPTLVLLGGLAGCLGGFYLQYWISKISYPLNIGGRPLNSWPAFIPVTFELTILCAAFTTVIGMIVLNGLPMPYHPVFNEPRFAHATQDAFFLAIEATDPIFDRAGTKAFLEGLAPSHVTEVDL
jgi:hypothetical protein